MSLRGMTSTFSVIARDYAEFEGLKERAGVIVTLKFVGSMEQMYYLKKGDVVICSPACRLNDRYYEYENFLNTHGIRVMSWGDFLSTIGIKAGIYESY